MDAERTGTDATEEHADTGRTRYSTAAGDTPVAVGGAEAGTAGAPGYDAVTAGATDFADDAEAAQGEQKTSTDRSSP
jgi:hypothetical protein